jgi:DNA-directed RNA polymerase subunit RPC12/RpoP
MALSGRKCPDCGRRVKKPFQETILGREVCPDCAHALFMGSGVGAITGNLAAGYGVWATLMRRIRRSA